MMVKTLQPPQHLLRAAGGQPRQMIGTQKAVTVNMTKNLPVAGGQLKGRNIRRTFEAGKSSHHLILADYFVMAFLAVRSAWFNTDDNSTFKA